MTEQSGQKTCARCGGETFRGLCVNPHCRIAELEDQVDALTAQLQSEEAAVKRLRGVILGAPKGIVLGDVRRGQRYIGAWQGACIPEDWKVGTKLALVRLDGLELADTGDDK